MFMKKIKNHLLLYPSLLLICSLAGSGLCQAIPANQQDLDNRVVAIVNDKKIMQQELMHEVNKNLLKYKKYGMNKSSPELLATMNKRVLNNMIDSKVLSQAIQQHKSPNFDAEAKEEFETFKSQFPNEENFHQYLRAKQLTEDTMLASLKYKLKVNAYLESKGILDIAPAEDEIRSKYEKQKETFKTEERVKVRHILIEFAEDADETTRKAAQQKAENILVKSQSGEDFAKLAEEHSDCQQSKSNGGELNFVKRGFMPPEFDKVAFSIEEKTTSEIVATQHGYHILQVLERKPAGYLSYDEARDFLGKYIENQEISKVRTAHVQQLRKQAKIQIFLDTEK